LPSDVIGVNMEDVKDPLTPSRASYHHGDLRRTLLETALRLIAERGPERRLVAARDADGVDHRRKVCVGA
jgi:hypothetical protein